MKEKTSRRYSHINYANQNKTKY